YSEHDALPADHGAKSESDGNGDFYPQWNKARNFVDVDLVIFQRGGISSRKIRCAAFLHDAQGFAGQVHVITKVAHLVVGLVLEILELSHFRADVVDQSAHGQHGVGLEFLGADKVRNVIAGIANG